MTYDVYSALGNKVRAKLLLCLKDRAKSVSELIETCGLSQSAVSQHLTKLKQSRLVKSEKLGKQMFYSIRYKKATDVSSLLMALEQEVI